LQKVKAGVMGNKSAMMSKQTINTNGEDNCQLSIINCQLLSKLYGNMPALKNVSFDVRQGEIYGVIGPDGAGKTTLFRILATLMLADSGTATVCGLDVVRDYQKIRGIIGYMPGRFSLYQDLTVEENLRFFATIYRTSIEENYHLIEDIYRQIEPFKKRRAGKLSGGMKQKLALSCALIHKPAVLLLDEPTTGVDPVSRKEFWEMLMKLKAQGITILVSTPYMDEATLCDRIALILNGQFMQVDTPQNIVAGYSEILWAVKTNRMHRLLKDLQGHPSVKSAFSFGETFHVTVRNGFGFAELQTFLSNEGHEDVEIQSVQPTIEDRFIQLTIES
jgi:ABC-type multidrug transport system ATPase subunit